MVAVAQGEGGIVGVTSGPQPSPKSPVAALHPYTDEKVAFIPGFRPRLRPGACGKAPADGPFRRCARWALFSNPVY